MIFEQQKFEVVWYENKLWSQNDSRLTTTWHIKMHNALDGIFTVLWNDKYNEYATIRSSFKFAMHWQQPQICSFIY